MGLNENYDIVIREKVRRYQLSA